MTSFMALIREGQGGPAQTNLQTKGEIMSSWTPCLVGFLVACILFLLVKQIERMQDRIFWKILETLDDQEREKEKQKKEEEKQEKERVTKEEESYW